MSPPLSFSLQTRATRGSNAGAVADSPVLPRPPPHARPACVQVHRKLSAEPKTGSKLSQLSFYSVPPTEKLSVTEFEEFAYDRLKLLNVIDMARAKGLKGPDLEKTIRKGRDDCMPNTPAGAKKDRFSHFILRLAYCRSEDLRRWYLQNEVELFKWRFVNNPPDDMNLWLKGHSMNYEAISKDEAATLREPLLAAFLARPHPKESDPMSLFERQEHYKVGFEQVLDLVRQRRVYLEAGFAYVPASDLVSIVANQFRMHLSKQLSSMARAWPALREEESERLSGFLESLATQRARLSRACPYSEECVCRGRHDRPGGGSAGIGGLGGACRAHHASPRGTTPPASTPSPSLPRPPTHRALALAPRYVGDDFSLYLLLILTTLTAPKVRGR